MDEQLKEMKVDIDVTLSVAEEITSRIIADIANAQVLNRVEKRLCVVAIIVALRMTEYVGDEIQRAFVGRILHSCRDRSNYAEVVALLKRVNLA